MPITAVPSDDDLLRLDRQLCFALYSASLAMTKLYKPLLAELGLTYPQYLVLLALWQQDGRTVSDLGAELSLDSGTLTPLLKRMEEAELLTRTRDPADERRVVVTLTTAGRRLKQRARRLPACILEATGCAPGEVANLTRQLQALKEQLSA